MLKHIDDKMFAVIDDPDRLAVERFKQFTRHKLRGLRCPRHGQPPRLRFAGASLGDIAISMTGCCERLMTLANARIASPPVDADLRKPA